MRIKTVILILTIIFSTMIIQNHLYTCTSAIINSSASDLGVPMLWKNRDTGYLSNKIIFVNEDPYNYIGIVNAAETSGRFVYAGLNSTGFGIINTVAYNLPKKVDEMHDLEGQIMAAALRTCRTVDDFEEFIRQNLGEALGSWANFGVIDAQGRAVVFEVHNNGYKKLDTTQVPKKYYVNTNFSRSGVEGKGAGYLRFEQATALFNEIKAEKITHEYIFQNISRSFQHPLVKHPTHDELRKQPQDQPFWLNIRDCINRPSTSGVVIINGKKPGKKNSRATLWALLGEPVTSIAVPLWVEAGEVPKALYQGEAAPMCAEALRIKKIIQPFSEGSKGNYMNATKLINKKGTGFLPLLMKTEREIFKATRKFLKKKHSAKEYAKFQEQMAQKALNTLKKIK